MKTLILRSILAAVLGFFTLTLNAQAPNDGPAAGDRMDRLDRMERRLNELAERQEQFMRQAGARMERQQPMRQASLDKLHPPGPMQASPAQPFHQPVVKAAKGIGDLLGLLFLIGVICNILLAIWIYADIRKRGEGSGIFIAMALVAGIPAAIIYALTRIGDRKV